MNSDPPNWFFQCTAWNGIEAKCKTVYRLKIIFFKMSTTNKNIGARLRDFTNLMECFVGGSDYSIH